MQSRPHPKEGHAKPQIRHYLIQSEPQKNPLLRSRIREQRPDPAISDVGNKLLIPTALPPPNEQAAIVRYLDDADQRIRAYVSAKERLIALLEEERQAVIHQAVTRGLDPNVKLKPSGVEWLGDVPEHWDSQVESILKFIREMEGRTRN